MRFDVPERKTLVHQMVIPIRWGDMDVMGHVNNTVYFRYFEIARIAWWDTLGYRPRPGGEGLVIVNAFCNFHRQLEYPGDVVARHFVANPGRSSFDTYLTLERSDEPGVLYASGGAKAVWIDIEQQKSAPLPDWLRRVVETLGSST